MQIPNTASELSRPQFRAGRAGAVRIQLYTLLFLADLGCIFGAFALSPLGRHFGVTFHSWSGVATVSAVIYAGLAFNGGAYSIDVLRHPARGVGHAMGALSMTFVAMLLVAYFLRFEREVSRSLLLAVMAGAGVLLFLVRHSLGAAIQRNAKGRFLSELVILDDVVIGNVGGAEVIDAAANALKPNLRDPMMLDRFAGAVKDYDRVIIACHPDAKRSWAMLMKGANVRGEVLAQEYDAVGAFAVDTLHGRTTLVVATGPLSVRNRMIKRTLDLLFSVPALVALAPVLLFTAIAIKLTSPGPIFFKQKRVGRGNALFEIYKFRSMRAENSDADGARSTQRDDDRITRVGTFIRKTSIDELPQLLNVLFGSMSLVGPRPHALGSMAGEQLFWEVDERYWHRHALKPGITGLAQVRGFRGATHRSDDLSRRLQADLEYISGWSVWRDIHILLSTVRVIIHPNAF